MERKKIRADFYDYNDGIFFVTVVTAKHEPFFGKIENDCMILSEIGTVLNRTLTECTTHFPDISIHVMQIMPNHFHTIMEVNNPHKSGYNDTNTKVGCLRASNHDMKPELFTNLCHHNSRLAVAVGGIKSATSKLARTLSPSFAWQSRFYEHRIRNGVEYDMIYQYIQENPQRWGNDRFNC